MFAFGIGVTVGVTLVCLVVGGYLLTSEGSSPFDAQRLVDSIGVSLIKHRELRSTAEGNFKPKEPQWQFKEIQVKNLPAVLLESQRQEQVTLPFCCCCRC